MQLLCLPVSAIGKYGGGGDDGKGKERRLPRLTWCDIYAIYHPRLLFYANQRMCRSLWIRCCTAAVLSVNQPFLLSLPPPTSSLCSHLLGSVWLARLPDSLLAIGSRHVEVGFAARCVIKLVRLSQYAFEAAASWSDLYGGDGGKRLVTAVATRRPVLTFTLSSPLPYPSPDPRLPLPLPFSPLPSPRRRRVPGTPTRL